MSSVVKPLDGSSKRHHHSSASSSRSTSTNSSRSSASRSSSGRSAASPSVANSIDKTGQPTDGPVVTVTADKTKDKSSEKSNNKDHGVILRRDSNGRNWFHGPDGMIKQQTSWKIPVNRVDPEINVHTSHGRRSRMAVRRDMDAPSSALVQGTLANGSVSKRANIRRVSTIGSVADVRELETMSIESLTSMDMPDVKAGDTLSDSDTDSATDTRRRDRRRQ